MEEWREVPGFPGYSVSSEGLVRNDARDTILARVVNNQNVTYVSLVRNGIQQKRALGLLVAQAFLEPHVNPFFNTPIYLDGNRLNTAASNLMWRPKWFAMRFHKQFEHRAPAGMRPDIPVEELETRERFSDVWGVVMTFGLIWSEVYTAAVNYTYHSSPYACVWPTGQQFRLL